MLDTRLQSNFEEVMANAYRILQTCLQHALSYVDKQENFNLDGIELRSTMTPLKIISSLKNN